MEFKDLAKKGVDHAKNYQQKYDVKFTPDNILLKLMEEVGELAQAALIHQRQCRPDKYVSCQESKKRVGEEMVDVLDLLFVAADTYGVDLEEIAAKKWTRKSLK